MSYYDDSSLFVAPNGYKTSVLFAQKPMDPNGQLAFTRSNDTATRVGPDGLIEKVRTNLLLQSQTFDNASWVKLNSATVTANTTIAPDGTLTADTLSLAVAANSSIFQATSTISQLTFSVFVKVASGTKDFRLRFDAPAATTSANFTATTTWQRFTFTATTTGIGGVYIINDSIGTAGDLIIWAAQVETGDIATDYIPTTTTAVSVGPVANLPRLNYPINSDGSVGCPSLLLEPQRTNLATYSEQMDNAGWGKTGNTITANVAISPDGTQNADRLTSTAVGSIYAPTYTFPSNNTISLFVKYESQQFFQLMSGAVTTDYANFDIQNGIAGNVGSTTSNSRIEDYGGGWYRISATFGGFAGASNIYLLGTTSNTAGWFAQDPTTGKSTLLWGFQAESGAYATSYIPTLGAAVTRGADASYKASVSGLIGQTEGTLYAEVQNNSICSIIGSDNVVLSIEGASFTDLITILYQPNGSIFFIVVTGSLTQVLFIYSAGVTSSPKKIALAYKNNDFAFYVDGVQVGTDTSGTVPTCSNIGLGNYYNGGGISVINSKIVSQALLFKTRLSNQQLAELTTL